MTKVVAKRRVHCPIRHVGAFIVKWEDGSLTVKCSLLKACGDSCRYLEDANYNKGV